MQAKGAIPDCFCNFFVVSVNHTNLMLFVMVQLGANAILAVSLAVCKAGAAVKKIPLYQVHQSHVLNYVLVLVCSVIEFFRCCHVGLSYQLSGSVVAQDPPMYNYVWEFVALAEFTIFNG